MMVRAFFDEVDLFFLLVAILLSYVLKCYFASLRLHGHFAFSCGNYRL